MWNWENLSESQSLLSPYYFERATSVVLQWLRWSNCININEQSGKHSPALGCVQTLYFLDLDGADFY